MATDTRPETVETAEDYPIDERTLAVRHPAVPITIEDLAALRGAAMDIIDTRATVLDTLRARSIRATYPTDWVLYKAPEEQGGQVVGYLQQCGAQRLLDVWGISVYDVSEPQLMPGTEQGAFSYRMTGSGRSNITGQVVEKVEGSRHSLDDVVRGKSGPALDDAVRKNTRANLDGNIARRLSGLNSVPADELQRVWATCTPPRSLDFCRLGRGFGSRSERLGGTAEKAPDVPPPVCPHCGTTGAYRPAKDGRSAFYGCPKYASHKDKKWIVDADAWQRQKSVELASACAVCGKAKDKHADADHEWEPRA